MCRVSLAALALLAATLLPACGMRFSGSYSSGSSFTTTVPDPSLPGPRIGSFNADVSQSDYSAHSYGAVLSLEPNLRLEDYDLVARIFQDLNGDAQYSPGADRLLAKSHAATRDASAHHLSLNPIEFNFKPRHEPIGISWAIQGPDGKEYTEDRMFR